MDSSAFPEGVLPEAEPQAPPDHQLPLNRGRMPQIPEGIDEMPPGATRWPRIILPTNFRGRLPRLPHSRRTRGVSPLTLYNINNTDLYNDNTNRASGSRNNQCNRSREDEFKDYECCPQCYCSELMILCEIRNLPTLGIAYSKPQEEPIPPEDQVQPLEAYVKETEKVIKKLLSEIAERELA